MPDTTPNERCRICSNLLPEEYAMQKYGWPDDDTYLPGEAGQLIIVRDFRPYDSRKLQLRQCPICGTYYLYRTDYEFLVNGSEGEEFLTRLTNEEAAEYLITHDVLPPGTNVECEPIARSRPAASSKISRCLMRLEAREAIR